MRTTDRIHPIGALGQLRHKLIEVGAPAEQVLRVRALLDPEPDVRVDILRPCRQIDFRGCQERILLREAGRAGRGKHRNIRRGQGAKERDKVRSVLVLVQAMQDQKNAVEQFRRVDERAGELVDGRRRLFRYKLVVQDARDADEGPGLAGELQRQAAEDLGRVLVAGLQVGEEEECHGVFGQVWCRLNVLDDLCAGGRGTDRSAGSLGLNGTVPDVGLSSTTYRPSDQYGISKKVVIKKEITKSAPAQVQEARVRLQPVLDDR